MMDKYLEQDKPTVAYLFTRKDLTFIGTQAQGDVLYFIFSPKNLASNYAQLFLTKRAELIQPKDFADAQRTIVDIIWKWRKSRDE